MNNRLYLDLHVLQTVPPSCVNRDDTGSPKTAVYGGATRARVSSQAWKRAIRLMFEDILPSDKVGQRTKKIVEMVAEEIAALAPNSDADPVELAEKALKDATSGSGAGKGEGHRGGKGAVLYQHGAGKGARRSGRGGVCRQGKAAKRPQRRPVCGYGPVWPYGRQRPHAQLRRRGPGGPTASPPTGCRTSTITSPP